ncbi:hypothetical protein CP97_13935 [Aurantiacibacter atlanticus]|uniref:Uncharacterized protein n=1 Tax=Aurantiacibacter atlanticus TaxID=1648404 RepID=A0A0H4VEW5_9SPHN|nr:hypothetical protein CP97_13935 [Aurantiacibacter atlanticus]
MLLPVAWLFLICAFTFAWRGVSGLQNVRTYIPMIFFRGDLREDENVDFVSVIALYLFGTITCLGIANAIWRISS